MEGQLECKIGYIPHNYYFILHDQVLMYCKKAGKKHIGQIHLSICSVDVRDLAIHLKTGIENITLLFKNNTTRNQWHEQIVKENKKPHIQDEIAKIHSLQMQFTESLSFVNKNIKKNPNLNEYSDKLESYGNQLQSKINELKELLIKQTLPEFLSCESINDKHISSLLPAPKYQQVQSQQITYNIWAELKHQIYKQINTMDIPPYIRTPMTTLELVGRQMNYANLLEQANSVINHDLKIGFVMGFIVSAYANLECRVPFISVIHETYELIDNYKYISEQVTEDLIAYYATSANYTLNGQVKISNGFEELCFFVNLEKKIEINFKQGAEQIKVEFINHYIQINNLMINNPNISIYGKAIVKCNQLQGELNFYGQKIIGSVGSLSIQGNTEQLLGISETDEQIVLYLQNTQHVTDRHNQLLPPSDSRFRKDIIQYKKGDFYGSYGENENDDFQQSWFKRDEQNNQLLYDGGYFCTNKQSQQMY